MTDVYGGCFLVESRDKRPHIHCSFCSFWLKERASCSIMCMTHAHVGGGILLEIWNCVHSESCLVSAVG